MDIKKLQKRLEKFAKDRDWEQFHNPKNLSMALSVEVAELVEIFQWSNDGGLKEINDPNKRKEIEKEIADIFNYLVKLVDILDMDLIHLVRSYSKTLDRKNSYLNIKSDIGDNIDNILENINEVNRLLSE